MKCSDCGNQTFVRTFTSLKLGVGRGGVNKRLPIELVSCTNCLKVHFKISKEFTAEIIKLQKEVEGLEKKVAILEAEWKNSPQREENYNPKNIKPYRDLSAINDDLQRAKLTLKSKIKELKIVNCSELLIFK
jgi:hypothetical protein